jgi:hypothetical protein
MLAYISALFSWLACRFRSRVELELEVIALRHQVAVLHRQHPGRRRFVTIDRLLWVWLYRLWPRCLEVMVLVKQPPRSNGIGRAFTSTGGGGRGQDENPLIEKHIN